MLQATPVCRAGVEPRNGVLLNGQIRPPAPEKFNTFNIFNTFTIFASFNPNLEYPIPVHRQASTA
jgi:hypothetical protein